MLHVLCVVLLAGWSAALVLTLCVLHRIKKDMDSEVESVNHAIVEDGIVTNLVWLVPGTKFPGAVPCWDVPVQIGDAYINGVFFRGDERVLTALEQAEQEHLQELAELVEEIYAEDTEFIDE